jgi:hypothetical protein
MRDIILVATLGFEVLVGLLLLGTSIFSFLHARRGQDIASITFGVSFLTLFVAQTVLIFIVTRTGFPVLPSDHTLVYLPWYMAGSYLLFSLGVFGSIFLSGRQFVVFPVPLFVLMAIILGTGFVPGFFPGFPDFAKNGSWIWFATGVITLSAALMYYLFNIKRKEPFRSKMAISLFLVCLMAFILSSSAEETTMWYIAQVVRLIAFGMIFYEVQTHYI